jgi:hypothetical protein
MTVTAFDVRRENLRKLVLDKYDGNRAAFSRAAGVHQNQINLLLTDNDEHRRNLGEAFARKLEEALRLRVGYFDIPRSGDALQAVVDVRQLEIPVELSHMFRHKDRIHHLSFLQTWVGSLAGRITSPDNLFITALDTHDIEPEASPGDTVVIDIAVRAVVADGIYVLQRGTTLFLRRVAHQLSGGWVITGGQTEPMQIDSFKGIKVVGKIAMLLKLSVI